MAGLKDAGSEDVLEAKRRVADASAELDATRTCAAAALLFTSLVVNIQPVKDETHCCTMRPPAACGVMCNQNCSGSGRSRVWHLASGVQWKPRRAGTGMRHDVLTAAPTQQHDCR